jgi:hypothetical protein
MDALPFWFLIVTFIMIPANLFLSTVLYKPESNELKVIGICAASISMVFALFLGVVYLTLRNF